MRLSVPRALLCVMLLSMCTGLLSAPATAASAPARSTRNVTLGGVHVGLRAGTTQVVTVNHTRGYHARIAYWTHTAGGWHRRFSSNDGRIGYGGLVRGSRRQQGTGTTPLGTYGLISAFGMHPRQAGWALPYRRVHKGDYWVEDNGSRFYNRYRNKRSGGFRWWLKSGENTSERLLSYRQQYEWAIVTSFNRNQVRHRGAGIFLHVNGSGATAGCVSGPRWFIRDLIGKLAPDGHPVIAVAR
ncbi:MAG: hypothetical protein FWE71_00620 [Nocardioidaceae bacterium]|nr:hypothetical protein [Nocardioidaceae bacterium]MCL2612685.1 hypothetical protein [Nocardioidaceae bacterium]